MGRFITEDPAKAGNNWYAYTSNNPMSRVDPTGLEDHTAGAADGYDPDKRKLTASYWENQVGGKANDAARRAAEERARQIALENMRKILEAIAQKTAEAQKHAPGFGFSLDPEDVDSISINADGSGRITLKGGNYSEFDDAWILTKGGQLGARDGGTDMLVPIITLAKGLTTAVAAKIAKTLTGGEAKFGSALSNDYKGTFFAENPGLEGDVVVHHAVEQQVQTRFPGLVSDAEMHSLENLRGIPNELNNSLHLSTIRKAWNKFYRETVNPTREQLLKMATKIDDEFGHLFQPPVRKQ